MFLAHQGVGMGAKRFAPKTSLGTLLAAAMWADLLAWALVVVGIEHFAFRPGITVTNPLDPSYYPISHSLLTDVVWGALLATAYYVVRRYRRGSLLIFVAVVSHWFLDVLAHRPDLPLLPGMQKYVGLGLYNSRLGMLFVEGAIWLGGVVIYLLATRPKARFAGYVFFVPVTLLTWIWLVSLKGDPPPGSISQAGVISLVSMVVIVAWGYWTDRLRSSTR
jgi:hypothetical protein